MEVKKSPKADLENKRIIFLEIGFIFALLLVFLAFEWKVETATTSSFQTLQEETIEEEVIPITRQFLKPPPPPPAPKFSDVLDIVDDETLIEEELEIEDAENEDPIKKGTNQDLDEYGVGEEEAEEYGEDDPFLCVEQMPKFKGDMLRWIGRQIHYPSSAKDNGIMGRVIIQFIIEKDGSVSNVKVLRKIDPALDAEAVRVIRKMPKWKPGKQRGKPVRVCFNLPIDFNLD